MGVLRLITDTLIHQMPVPGHGYEICDQCSFVKTRISWK